MGGPAPRAGLRDGGTAGRGDGATGYRSAGRERRRDEAAGGRGERTGHHRGDTAEDRGERTQHRRDERAGPGDERAVWWRAAGAVGRDERAVKRRESRAAGWREGRTASWREGRAASWRAGWAAGWRWGRTEWSGGRTRWWPPLLVALVLAALGAPPVRASAPGAMTARADTPDMALVVAGGTGHTTLLRSGDRDFAPLWRLLAPRFTGTERVPDAWAAGDYPPVRATVIWGMTGVGGWPQTSRAPGGDVAIEREDQVFLAPDGTPWVRSDPSPDVADDDVRWHRAPRSVFDRLVERGGPFGPGSPEVPAAARAAGPGVCARWAVTGLAVGLVGGAGGTLLIRRAAARRDAAGPPREPRQELIDL